jgi:pyrroloquinoline quinone biosynthesis protein B
LSALSAIVLGAAAGGGYPQWNCRCAVCALAWARDPRVRARTQASLAVSADGTNWALLNASPDLRAQILAAPALHPAAGLRDTPIAAVVLTGGEIDQTAGLLCLRESQPFTLYATPATLTAVGENPMFRALRADMVRCQAIVPGARFTPVAGIEAELFTVPGKVPLYLETDEPEIGEDAGCVGIEIRANGKSLAYVPGVAAMTDALHARLARVDAILFDGTLFTDDEMIRSRTGTKTGRRMGHMPIDGDGGTLEALADVRAQRIFVHVNNTNPILVDGSLERLRITAAGWTVAEDGQEIVL